MRKLKVRFDESVAESDAIDEAIEDYKDLSSEGIEFDIDKIRATVVHNSGGEMDELGCDYYVKVVYHGDE